MPKNHSAKPSNEQLLGEIETRIAGPQYYEATVAPGEQVNLEREPGNPHDADAIRVENGLFEPVGHLPRRLCSWLAALVDAGKVRIDGYAPRNAANRGGGETSTRPLRVSIFLCKKGQGVLAKREVCTKLDALHEVVRRTYEEVQTYADADLILGVAEGLRLLARRELLPETRLLLALMPAVAREMRTNRAVEAMAALWEQLGRIQVDEPLHHHNLTVFPLSWPESGDPPYVLLGQVIESGEAVVEEVDEEGDVPNLAVTNNGRRPVLIPEGEILVGAKQNRVVNVTVLVAAGSTFTVPVSCVEQGRWRYQSRHFRSEFCAPPRLRSKKMQAVRRNRTARGAAESDQGEVWEEVAGGLSDLNVRSETGSLADGFEEAEEKLQPYRDNLQLPDCAAGVLMAQGDRVVGMDLFDCPATLQALWERWSDAYFFDALRNRRRRRKASRKTARQFLQRVGTHVTPRVPALGLGEELEIAGDEVVGAALLYSGRVCHLSAFANVP